MEQQTFRESDLIINTDGSIYHLCLKPGELAGTVLVVGDPARAGEIASFFDSIELSRKNREFYSYTGYYKGKRLTALSTGIGTDNIDIVMNELDALVNIDFSSRRLRQDHTTLQVVRLGTSGSVHPDVPAGAMVLSTHGLGIDGTMQYYGGLDGIADMQLTKRFIEFTGWPDHLPRPYIVAGSDELIACLDHGPATGITVTAPGFYAAQGREIRLQGSFAGMLEKISAFSHGGHSVVNFEMETSALYGLAKLLGHQAASVCVILANRIKGTYSDHYKENVQGMIRYVLDRLAE
jgi:uridine phosphorylase